MPKMKIRRSRRAASSLAARQQIVYIYRERYFNLWLGSWKWEGLDKYQRLYIMRKLWSDGKIAAFDIIDGQRPFLGGLAPKDQGDNSLLGFAPFALNTYNMYGFPATLTLINERATPYIPNRQMINGKDVVIGYALSSRQPIAAIAEIYIQKIVEVEMTIRTNLFAHKIPFVLETDNEGDIRGQDMIDRIFNDDLAFLVRPSQNMPKPASSGQQYIIDKLYNYKVALENELNTFLGIDNSGAIEKKERLIQDELNSQDALINDFSDSIGNNLREFCEEIEKVLGYHISVEATSSPEEAQEEQEAEKDPEYQDDGKEKTA